MEGNLGQTECLKVIKDKWLTTKEIAKKLKQNSGTVTHSLRRLYLHGEILRKEVKIETWRTYTWKSK